MIIFSNVLLVNANEMEHFSGWETGAIFAHIGKLIVRKRNTPKVEKAMIPCDWIEKYEFYLNKDRRDINSFRYLGSLKPFASGDTVSDIRLASHSWYSWGWTWSPLTSTFQVLEFQQLITFLVVVSVLPDRLISSDTFASSTSYYHTDCFWTVMFIFYRGKHVFFP